ncbi:MAG: ComF family protein [Christensenellales bacterium]
MAWPERIGRGILALLYPEDDRCMLCGAPGCRAVTGVCSACEAGAKRHLPPRCGLCGRQTRGGLCGNCRDAQVRYRGAVVYHYEGAIRDALHRLKFEGEARFTAFFAAGMARALSESGWPAPDVLVPVPTHGFRRLGRGYSLPGRLARALSRQTGIPVAHRALRRVTLGAMPGRSREERIRLAEKAFAAGQAGAVAGKRALLVDDITTTGATLNACAVLLLDMGASAVYALAAAGGPDPLT